MSPIEKPQLDQPAEECEVSEDAAASAVDKSRPSAHPDAASAENGEIVPSTPQDINDARDDAQHQQHRQQRAADAAGMRIAADEA